MHPYPSPDVERVVDSLERYSRGLARSSASFERSVVGEGRIHILTVLPHNPRACQFSVLGQQWLQLQTGEHGGCWELDYTDGDVRRTRQIIEAVVTGRVVEQVSLARSEVTVTLSSGEQVKEAGFVAPLGLIPLPGWRRRGRTVVYEPYQLSEPRA